jgi:hypothetical protein
MLLDLSDATGINKIIRIGRVVLVHTEGYAFLVTKVKAKILFKIPRCRLEKINQINPKGLYCKDEAKIHTAWYRGQ